MVHPGAVARTAVHAVEDLGDALKAGIADQPVLPDHIGHHVLGGRREQGVVLLQKGIETRNKFLQGPGGIVRPVFGQEMVVIDIHDDLAVVAVIFVKALAALPGDGVGVRKGVDLPVQADALLDLFEKMRESVTTDVVRNEIATGSRPIIEGEVYMCKVNHEQCSFEAKFTNYKHGFESARLYLQKTYSHKTLIETISGIRGTIRE